MKYKKDSYSEKLNLESFFLLIKLEKNIYSDHSRRILFYKKLEELINLGLKNLEVSWSDDLNWLDFVSKIKFKYPNIFLGSASIINKQSIEDSEKIGLDFSMMKFWDKDLFNFAKTRNHLLIPGIKGLTELKEAIDLNCKIIKIYPVKQKDHSIIINDYKNINFIAAGGIAIDELDYYKSLGYKSIIIGDQGFKNNIFNPKIYDSLKRK